MDERNWERVEDDDPSRCQAVLATIGQCRVKAMEGSKFCPAHGGVHAIAAKEKAEAQMYRLKKYQARLEEFSESDKIKSLRNEIGILRILIEERMNICHTDLDLMLHSSVLGDLVTKVEKLVTSCNRLEGQLGAMLDKTQALQLGSEIVEIVARHVENEEALESIANEIIEAIKGR